MNYVKNIYGNDSTITTVPSVQKEKEHFQSCTFLYFTNMLQNNTRLLMHPQTASHLMVCYFFPNFEQVVRLFGKR